MTATNMCYNFVGFRYSPPENSVVPPLLSSISQGGFTENFFFLLRLGRVGQGAWELGLPNTRKCHFLSDPCVFGYIF